MRCLASVLLCVLVGSAVHADDKTYIIYLHGRIIEEQGTTPTHPEYGLYDFPAVVAALGSRGAEVIADVREPGADMYEHAGKTISKIEQLINHGVAPGNIVVVGFSKGGGIAINVSSFLGRKDLRYVILASCHPAYADLDHYRLTGKVLSIFESSDELAYSCREFAEREPRPTSFDELEISTGKRHGAFYQPRREWIGPLLDWIG